MNIISNGSISIRTGGNNERLNINSVGTILGIGTYTAGNSIKIFEAQRSGGAVKSDWSYHDANTTMSFGTSTNHSLILKSNDTERIRIQNNGNIGIGTLSPGAKLHVDNSSADAVIRLSKGSSTIGNIDFVNEGNRFSIQDDGTRRLVIDTSGNVGIKTTSIFSGAELDVFGDIALIHQNWALRGNNGNADFAIEELSGSSFSDSNIKFYIKSGGNIGIGTTSPSAKLDVRKSGTTTDKGDTDLFVGDSGAASSTAQVQIHGGTSGFSNLYFSDASAYNVGGFIYNHSSNYLATNVNGSERMRIDSSGIVQINGYSNGAYLRSIGTVRIDIDSDNNQTDRSFIISKHSAGDELFRVQENGSVGIGTTSPSAKLDVGGSFILGGFTNVGRFKSDLFNVVYDISPLNSGGWARSYRIKTSDSTGDLNMGVFGGGTTTTYGYFAIGGSDVTGYNSSNSIKLTKSGNVGIGLGSSSVPSEKLHIVQNTSSNLVSLLEQDNVVMKHGIQKDKIMDMQDSVFQQIQMLMSTQLLVLIDGFIVLVAFNEVDSNGRLGQVQIHLVLNLFKVILEQQKLC